jgi:hypothetical protein
MTSRFMVCYNMGCSNSFNRHFENFTNINYYTKVKLLSFSIITGRTAEFVENKNYGKGRR